MLSQISTAGDSVHDGFASAYSYSGSDVNVDGTVPCTHDSVWQQLILVWCTMCPVGPNLSILVPDGYYTWYLGYGYTSHRIHSCVAIE